MWAVWVCWSFMVSDFSFFGESGACFEVGLVGETKIGKLRFRWHAFCIYGR